MLRQTKKKRMRRKLKEVKAKLRQRLHDPSDTARGARFAAASSDGCRSSFLRRISYNPIPNNACAS